MCIFSSKCKWHKHCSLYSVTSEYCTKTGGDYDINPFEFKPVGCYRLFEAQGKSCKYYIKNKEAGQSLFEEIDTLYLKCATANCDRYYHDGCMGDFWGVDCALKQQLKQKRGK